MAMHVYVFSPIVNPDCIPLYRKPSEETKFDLKTVAIGIR